MLKKRNLQCLLKQAFIGITVLGASVPVWAIGLGPLSIDSSLNQRLSASIELLSAEGQDLSYYRVSVASAEQFEALGLEKTADVSQLSFTVTTDPKGKPVVTLRSSKILKDPFLSLVVELSWPKGHIYREYTLLLDPPLVTLAPSLQSSEGLNSESTMPNLSENISSPGAIGLGTSSAENRETMKKPKKKKRTKAPVAPKQVSIEINDEEIDLPLTSFKNPVLGTKAEQDTQAGLKLSSAMTEGASDFDDLRQRLKTTEDTLDVLRRTNELLMERQQDLAKQNQDLMLLLEKTLHHAGFKVNAEENTAASPLSESTETTTPITAPEVPMNALVTSNPSISPTGPTDLSAGPALNSADLKSDGVEGASVLVETTPSAADGSPNVSVAEQTPVAAAPEVAPVQGVEPAQGSSYWYVWTILCLMAWGVYRLRLKKAPATGDALVEEKLSPIATEDDDLPFQTHYPSSSLKFGHHEPDLVAAPVIHEVDTISIELENVDIFLSYEKYTEAEKVLLSLQAKAPSRTDIKIRFAALYLGQQNMQAFDKTMQECTLRLKIEPNAELEQRLLRLKEAVRSVAPTLDKKSLEEMDRGATQSIPFVEAPALVSSVVPEDAPTEDETSAGHIEFEKVSFEISPEIKETIEFDDTNSIAFEKAPPRKPEGD